MAALLVMGTMSAEAMLSWQELNSQWNSPDSNYSVVKKTAKNQDNASCVLWINAVDYNVSKNVLFGFYEKKVGQEITRSTVVAGAESLGRNIKRSINVENKSKIYKISWDNRKRRSWSDALFDLIDNDAKVIFRAESDFPYIKNVRSVNARLNKTYFNDALEKFAQCRNKL